MPRPSSRRSWCPSSLTTAYRRNGRRYAAAPMGVAEADLTSWSHMIDKPPGTGRPTYWHQDEAYWEPSVEHRAVGAWMPLTECSVDMGCMQFLPGSHRGEILPHHSRRPDIRPDLYEVIAEIDDAAAVACPLPAGGATFHHSRTLHYTAPNVTDRPRRAVRHRVRDDACRARRPPRQALDRGDPRHPRPARVPSLHGRRRAPGALSRSNVHPVYARPIRPPSPPGTPPHRPGCGRWRPLEHRC